MAEEISAWIKNLKGEGAKMATLDRNWRPDDWDRLKELIVTQTPISFSPSTGYSKSQKDDIIEATASMLLGAVVEVLVTE